jgi:hypothetical protein
MSNRKQGLSAKRAAEDACILGVTASGDDILAKVARAWKTLDATRGADIVK